jgi:glucose/mannose-6-phosphate isomerase
MTHSLSLDDLSYAEFDPQQMGERIRELPTQLREAWDIAQRAPLPDAYREIRRLVVVGMGGSAIGGDLLGGLMDRAGSVPVTVVRGYDLPPYIAGEATLVVGSSYSGSTEETLSCFEQARDQGARLLAMTGGGPIAEIAEQAGAPVWRFSYDAQPRAALGYSFTLLLGLACRLDVLPDAGDDVPATADLLEEMQSALLPATPTDENPAKQLARDLHGKLPSIFGSGVLAPVARRWKGQFNENAKQWGLWDELPELNHNLVVGLAQPAEVRARMAAIFLRSKLDHPRVQTRWEVTEELFERNDIPVYALDGRGDSALAQMFSLIHLGDYVSYYTAALNGEDPTPVSNIAYLKQRLAES